MTKRTVLYSGVHKRPLYHWTGRDIEFGEKTELSDGSERYIGPRSPLDDKQRKKYIKRVKDTLASGLWVKPPKEPEQIGAGKKLINIHQPIVCFTEWELKESIPHVSRYGRLGFGFTKQFVLASGGQPVTYVNNKLKLPYLKSFLEIHKLLDKLKLKLPADTQIEQLVQEIEYLSAYHKNIRKIRAPLSATPSPAEPKTGTDDRATRTRMPPDEMPRDFGNILHYLEEREWRVVYDQALEAQGRIKSNDPGNTPPHHLPFVPGKDLTSIVLPDSRCVKMAINDEALQTVLYPKGRREQHVALISLHDIGNF
jgi:hypothetical protein